jgi:hypothetical protein
MKNKTYIQGAIDTLIALYREDNTFLENQAFGYNTYEVNDKWMISFSYVTVDIPSTESDPTLDNSVIEFESLDFKILKTESLLELKEQVFAILDVIRDFEIEEY